MKLKKAASGPDGVELSNGFATVTIKLADTGEWSVTDDVGGEESRLLAGQAAIAEAFHRLAKAAS